MHPLVMYDIARLEQAELIRDADAQRHVRAARGFVGRPRRQLLMGLQRWLRPARVTPHSAA